MAKVWQQLVPSEVWKQYIKALLPMFKHGFNFYLDAYIYFPAWTVKKARRRPESRYRLGVKIWHKIPVRLSRWAKQYAAYLWYNEPLKKIVDPPWIGHWGRYWWKQIDPTNWRRVQEAYAIAAAEYIDTWRKPPWQPYDMFFLTNYDTSKIIYYHINPEHMGSLFGEEGPQPGQLKNPMGITQFRNRIIVANMSLNRIDMWDSTSLQYIGAYTWYGVDHNPFDLLSGIGADWKYIYVLEINTHKLIRFDKTNPLRATVIYLNQPYYNSMTHPRYILVTNSSIFITSEDSPGILHLQRETLTPVPYSSALALREPATGTWRGMDTDGHFLYVANHDAGKISILLLSRQTEWTSKPGHPNALDVKIVGDLVLILYNNGTTIRLTDTSFNETYYTYTAWHIAGSRYLTPMRQHLFVEDLVTSYRKYIYKT